MAIRPLHTAQEDSAGKLDVPGDVAIGAQVRTLRKAKNLTLKQVAALADISVGYLSEIERDITRVPIGVLQKLCQVFEVSIGWLLGMTSSGPENERNLILREADRTRLTFPGLGISEELISPDTSGPLEVLISTLEPGADSDEYAHEGYEVGLVTEGELDLWVDSSHYLLRKGDSFSFPSTQIHRCANRTKKVTKVIWIITPPHY
mgnify:CR=1 FL=1